MSRLDPDPEATGGCWVEVGTEGEIVGAREGALTEGRASKEVGSDNSGETKMDLSQLKSEKLGWLATGGRTIASIGSEIGG